MDATPDGTALRTAMTARPGKPMAGDPDDPAVQAAAARALDLVTDGARLGLGTGRAVEAFILLLGAHVRSGLRVTAAATSDATARFAAHCGIPLIELEEHVRLDVTIDGADEVAPNLDLLKGRGGALVRERIVAATSQRQIIIIGSEKLVGGLGEHGPIAVEVVPFGVGLALRELKSLGLGPRPRADAASARPSLTENGNVTLDCSLEHPLAGGRAARELERRLLAVAGVVDTGLFLGTAERVLVGYPDGRVDERCRPARRKRR